MRHWLARPVFADSLGIDVTDTEVVIVGAGPVGLTLANDLGRRGIRCVLLEQESEPAFLPKMERCNARTMEMYRRIGLADRIRSDGLPAACAMDVYIILAMNQPPLLQLKYPSVEEARVEIASCRDGSKPLEPYQLISQYTLEPLLKAETQGLSAVTVRYGTELLEFSQDQSAVTVSVRRPDGTVETLHCKYLVGCDGG